MTDKCPICGGDLFENEYRDIQCVECRSIVPFHKPNWKVIKEAENFIIEYDTLTGKYRVSYFEDNHFVDDIIFDTAFI